MRYVKGVCAVVVAALLGGALFGAYATRDAWRPWLQGSAADDGKKADDAARLDTPDWQILLKLKSEGFNLLLPEVQQLRKLESMVETSGNKEDPRAREQQRDRRVRHTRDRDRLGGGNEIGRGRVRRGWETRFFRTCGHCSRMFTPGRAGRPSNF